MSCLCWQQNTCQDSDFWQEADVQPFGIYLKCKQLQLPLTTLIFMLNMKFDLIWTSVIVCLVIQRAAAGEKWVCKGSSSELLSLGQNSLLLIKIIYIILPTSSSCGFWKASELEIAVGCGSTEQLPPAAVNFWHWFCISGSDSMTWEHKSVRMGLESSHGVSGKGWRKREQISQSQVLELRPLAFPVPLKAFNFFMN